MSLSVCKGLVRGYILATNLQRHPLQYWWLLLHLEIWRRQFSLVTQVLSQWRTGRVRCRISLDLFLSHGLCSAMCQRGFPQYLPINLPPPHYVRLLENDQSEDRSHMGMSGISANNPITVAVLVTRYQHQQLCLIYRVVPSRPLHGRWFSLYFACTGCLSHRCGDGASG